MLLGTEVGLGPGDIALDGPQLPSPKGGTASLQFSAHFYCGQTVEWIKMKLVMQVGLGSGHVVLDGDTAPLPKVAHATNFRPMLSILDKRLDGSRWYLAWRWASVFATLC